MNIQDDTGGQGSSSEGTGEESSTTTTETGGEGSDAEGAKDQVERADGDEPSNKDGDGSDGS